MTDPLDDPIVSLVRGIKRAGRFAWRVLCQGGRDIAALFRWGTPRVAKAGVAMSKAGMAVGSVIRGTTALDCHTCGGIQTMTKQWITKRSPAGYTLGCGLFLLFVVLAFVTIPTIILPIIFGILAFASLLMGARRDKVWKCRQCGHHFARD